MARRNQDELIPGSDSFLDVMANMVGILIILVVVVGVRIEAAPTDEPLVATPPPAEQPAPPPPVEHVDLETPARQVAALSSELADLENTGRQLAGEEGSMQALAAALTEQNDQQQAELERRRQQLGQLENASLTLAAKIDSATQALADLDAKLEATETTKRKSVTIQNLPTPLSQTVYGSQVHYQMVDGRLAAIPLDDLLEAVKNDLSKQAWKLRNQMQVTTTVGPVGDFRVRYTIERHEIPLEEQIASGRGGVMLQVSMWSLIPSRHGLGEPTEMALRDGSQFLRELARLNPKRDAVTVWVYPDSFEAFRDVRKKLHELGFACAGRPLPEGVPISGSPYGSRSEAQ